MHLDVYTVESKSEAKWVVTLDQPLVVPTEVH